MNLDYFWIKLLATIPIAFLTISDDQNTIIWGILLIVIVDTILGVSVAIKYKRFLSYKLTRVTKKITRYAFALTSMAILCVVEPTLFGWTFHALGVFIILGEVISNLEKLSLLGMKIPTKIISKLNDKYKEYNGDRKLANKILDDRDAK